MRKTIGDRLNDFYVNYLARSKDEYIGKKENQINNPRDGTDKKHDGFNIGTKKLPMWKCAEVAEQCPLFMKGVRKKSMDSVRSWYKIDTKDGTTNPIKTDLDIINEFEERNELLYKFYLMSVDSMIYGDGFLLITFKHDDKTEIYEPPSKDAVPYSVQLICPEHIDKLDYYGRTEQEKEMYRSKGIKHFHFNDKKNMEEYWIHPDRILHLPGDRTSRCEFGESKVNLLRNVIKSKINIDIAAGETLSWFAHGVYDIGIQNCDENDVDYWEKKANEHPGAWIHDKEREEIKLVEPKAIDPKPYYDFIVLNIATAIIMPVHILTGVQVGRVTGAEVGTGDYYKDVRDMQDLKYSPLLRKLHAWLLKGHNYNMDEKPPIRRWKYKFIWNPIYTDERSEAEIMKTRIEAAALALNGPKGGVGFIEDKEAREMYNKGQIQLDTDKKPKPPQPPKPEKPTVVDDDSDDEEENEYTRQLDQAEKAMIKRRKEVAERERSLGEEILKDQEDVSDSD